MCVACARWRKLCAHVLGRGVRTHKRCRLHLVSGVLWTCDVLRISATALTAHAHTLSLFFTAHATPFFPLPAAAALRPPTPTLASTFQSVRVWRMFVIFLLRVHVKTYVSVMRGNAIHLQRKGLVDTPLPPSSLTPISPPPLLFSPPPFFLTLYAFLSFSPHPTIF